MVEFHLEGIFKNSFTPEPRFTYTVTLSNLDELPKSLVHLPLLAEILNNWASFLKMYSFEEFSKILVLLLVLREFMELCFYFVIFSSLFSANFCFYIAKSSKLLGF